MIEHEIVKTFSSAIEAENFIADQKRKYTISNVMMTETDEGVTVMYDKEHENFFPRDNYYSCYSKNGY